MTKFIIITINKIQEQDLEQNNTVEQKSRDIHRTLNENWSVILLVSVSFLILKLFDCEVTDADFKCKQKL